MFSYKDLFLIGFLFLLMACAKQEERSIDVKLQTLHHEEVVPNTTIYLKENVTVFPGFDVDEYDQQFTTDDAGVLLIQKLDAGNYYLLGLGHDGIDSVYGHQPLVLNRTMYDMEIEQIMWVSEVH